MTTLEISPRPGIDTSMIERATALLPLLRENATETERLGKLAQANVDALQVAGLFDLTKPTKHDGLPANVATIVEAVAEVSRGCPSTGWVLHALLIGRYSSCLLPTSAQERIFAGGTDARICGTFAPTASVAPVDGGYRVSGAWGYASGCRHADWIFAGIGAPGPDGDIEFGQALIPMAEARIEQTWKVTGLKGTGSDTVHVHDVFVPADMFLPSLRAADGEFRAPYDDILFRSDWVPTLALVTVSPLVGIAREALSLTRSTMGDRPLPYTLYEHTRDAPPTYNALAEAAAMVDTATLHMSRVADAIDRAAQDDTKLSVDQHAQFRMDVGLITRQCQQAVELLMDVNGSSGFKESNPIQRYWRDMAIAARHGFLMPSLSREFYGRHLTGATQTADLL